MEIVAASKRVAEMSTIISLLLIFTVLLLLSFFIIKRITRAKEQRKQRDLLEQIKAQNREEIESQRREVNMLREKKREKARGLLLDEDYLKLFNAVNEENVRFANDPSTPKAVFDHYPYCDFYIREDCITGGYIVHDPTFRAGIKYAASKPIIYKDLGIENMTTERAELIAAAFEESGGYVYKGGNHVVIDGKYWHATKSAYDFLGSLDD